MTVQALDFIVRLPNAKAIVAVKDYDFEYIR